MSQKTSSPSLCPYLHEIQYEIAPIIRDNYHQISICVSPSCSLIDGGGRYGGWEHDLVSVGCGARWQCQHGARCHNRELEVTRLDSSASAVLNGRLGRRCGQDGGQGSVRGRSRGQPRRRELDGEGRPRELKVGGGGRLRRGLGQRWPTAPSVGRWRPEGAGGGGCMQCWRAGG